MHNMKGVITGIFIPSLFFKEYSLNDKINLWKGKATAGISVMWNEIISQDLAKENTKFEIPVYFFHGIFDYTCLYQLAKGYYDAIESPEKGFFTSNNSAHSPIFEEPVECINIIKGMLRRTNYRSKGLAACKAETEKHHENTQAIRFYKNILQHHQK